jgi:raffinose/stachyose/melibiose transport system substrate-binding protein
VPSRSSISKKLTALAVAATAAALALSGCSTGAPTTPGGDVNLTFSIQTPDPENSNPQLWAAVQAFQDENPNIHIELSGEPVAEHLQKLQVAAQSDTLPDIFWIYDANARELNDAGKLLDVRPILQDADVLQYYPESTIQGFSEGDVLYGQPSSGLVTGLWYNKAILDANGLDVPVTFDDFLDVTKALSAAGITTISNGANQSTFSCWSFLRDLSNFGWDEKVDAIFAGDESYNNPDFAKLYQHIDELRAAGAFSSNVATQTYAQAVSNFTSGGAAFLDAGIWASAEIQASGIANDAGFWVGPQFADGVGEQNIAMNVPAAPYAFSAKSASDPAKLDALTKWIVFWAGEQAAQLQVDGGLPPSTTWDVHPPADQTVFQGALDAAFAEGTVSPANQPDLMVSTQIATAMYDSIYGVIQGQLSPDQAMALVQTAIDAE